MRPNKYSDEQAKYPKTPSGPFTPSMPINPDVRDEIRNGSPYCFTEQQIWYRDDFNGDIFKRPFEVDTLVSRTNELTWFPEPTQNQVCFKRVLAEQQYFDSKGCPRNPAINYNSHYLLPPPEHDLANIRNVPIENELFRLGHLIDRDCMTKPQADTLQKGQQLSEQEIAEQFKYYTAFPSVTKKYFDTNTSQIFKTVDPRNKYIINTNDIYPYDYTNKGLKM